MGVEDQLSAQEMQLRQVKESAEERDRMYEEVLTQNLPAHHPSHHSTHVSICTDRFTYPSSSLTCWIWHTPNF